MTSRMLLFPWLSSFLPDASFPLPITSIFLTGLLWDFDFFTLKFSLNYGICSQNFNCRLMIAGSLDQISVYSRLWASSFGFPSSKCHDFVCLTLVISFQHRSGLPWWMAPPIILLFKADTWDEFSPILFTFPLSAHIPAYTFQPLLLMSQPRPSRLSWTIAIIA